MAKSALRLRLYIAGDAPNSTDAIRHLRILLAKYAIKQVDVEIVDVLKQPELALRDGVLITPTMVRLFPRPERRIIGNLKDTLAVLAVLGFEAIL